jgi:hypothetical protein
MLYEIISIQNIFSYLEDKMKLNISSNSVEFQIYVLEHRDVPIFIVLFLYETLARLIEKFKEEVKRRKWRKLDYKNYNSP